MGSAKNEIFHAESSAPNYIIFCVFLSPVWLNRAHLGMVGKVSSSCKSRVSTLFNNDYVTSGIRDAVRMGV